MATFMTLTDLACKECGEFMTGIVNYDARTVCEPCGGNKTEYHAENPLPGGMTDVARKQARA